SSFTGGIFVFANGALTAPVKLNDATPCPPAAGCGGSYGKLTVVGAPSMNAAGVLAFRGTTQDLDGIELDGVFTFDGAAYTRVAFDSQTLVPPADPENFQLLLGFGDLVSLNDAGDVAFAAGGMIDINAAGDLQFGTVVVPAGQPARLVIYPGLEVEA